MKLSEFEIDPDQIPAPKPRKRRTKSAKPSRKLKFYLFPPDILEAVITRFGPSSTSAAALVILMALYESCYLDPQHRIKIRLTSKELERFGIGRMQKWRALQMLAAANIVTLDRTNGKNPCVTAHWLANWQWQ
jgi:hypothetical protein